MKKLFLILVVLLAGCSATKQPAVDYSYLDSFEITDGKSEWFAPADKEHFVKCLSTQDECLAEPMQLGEQLDIKRFNISIRYSEEFWAQKYLLIAAAKLAHREGFSLITPLSFTNIRSGLHSWDEKSGRRFSSFEFIAHNSHDDIKNGVLDILCDEDIDDKCVPGPNTGVYLMSLYLTAEQVKDISRNEVENDGRMLNVFGPKQNAWREAYPVLEIIESNTKSVFRCWMPNILNDGQRCWEENI